ARAVEHVASQAERAFRCPLLRFSGACDHACEPRTNAASMAAFFPADAAGCASVAPILFLVPLLTMLIPPLEARSVQSTAGERSPGLNGPWKALGLDGAIIPRSPRCLLDGFDPAGMLLLFSCGN